MNVNKMDKPNQGVKCEVVSCYFYGAGDCCTAEKIEVKSKNAHSIEETDCATFRGKSY